LPFGESLADNVHPVIALPFLVEDFLPGDAAGGLLIYLCDTSRREPMWPPPLPHTSDAITVTRRWVNKGNGLLAHLVKAYPPFGLLDLVLLGVFARVVDNRLNGHIRDRYQRGEEDRKLGGCHDVTLVLLKHAVKACTRARFKWYLVVPCWLYL